MRIAGTALLLFLLLAGCGYHVQGRGGSLPADVQAGYVEIFANSTLEPFLDITISKAVAERFQRGRFLRTTDVPSAADVRLSGEVTAYATVPIAYDRSDEIARYLSTMTVAAQLVRSGNADVLWKGTISWSEEYPASQDKALQEDFEAAAIRVISERIAEEIYFRLGDGF